MADAPPAGRTGAASTNAGYSSSTGERFSLSGPSGYLDDRVHAYRRDIADIALAGRIIAPHYARPIERACGIRSTPVLRQGKDEAEQVSELLPGERFHVLEYSGGWAWGYCGTDHVSGYVEAIELAEPGPLTHVVCEKSAPVLADESVAATLLAHLPMGARLLGEERGACLVSEVGCVPLSHLRRLGECEEDPVSVAERLIGVPYKAGGRTSLGLDGPGLIQLVLGLCGQPVPRLPEQQARLGMPVPSAKPPKRGDLIAFANHVGLMMDDLMMIHACPHAGRVVVEPLAVAGGRERVVDRRRLS